MLMILISGTTLFFVMPRMSAGYLGGYSYGTDFSSGFSDRVQLGQIGQIQQSDSVVMHIQIEGDQSGRYNLHWRGVSLADFDGHMWSNPKIHSPCVAGPTRVSPSRMMANRPDRTRQQIWNARIDPLQGPDGADRNQCVLSCSLGDQLAWRLSRCYGDSEERLRLRLPARHQPLRSDVEYRDADSNRIRSAGRNYPTNITDTISACRKLTRELQISDTDHKFSQERL